MGKHKTTMLDRARDELMSHVIRCDVFDASMKDRTEWLGETMDYMAERYPQLNEIKLAKLEMMGRHFIKPPIPHGRGHSARTRDEDLSELVEAEIDENATEAMGSPAEAADGERLAA